MVSTVTQVTCGVTTTLSSCNSGLSAATGSTEKTSRPAAASRPSRKASTRAARRRCRARSVDQQSLWLHVIQRGAVDQPVGVRVNGRCRLTMSLWASSRAGRARSVCRRRRCWCATPLHPSRAGCARHVWRCCRNPPSRRCNCRCRARLGQGRSVGQAAAAAVATSSVGNRRSAASISSTVPSATEGALAPACWPPRCPTRWRCPRRRC